MGVGVFLTDTPGIGGRLRASAQDFVVREVSRPPPRQAGPFTVATVTSTNWETNRLVDALAHQLHLSRNAVGFAGTKDKRAVTTQLMSFKAPPERVSAVQLGDVTIADAYTTSNGLQLGQLVGNEFELVVSEVEFPSAGALQRELDETTEQLRDHDGAPNFFGPQRFGTLRPCTHLVGRRLTEGDVKGAVMTYLTSPAVAEDTELQHLRDRLRRDEDWSAALEAFPQPLNFERAMLSHLVSDPGDFRGALLRLPRNLLLMFIHAFQSYLFNRILTARLQASLPLGDPVIGDLVLPADRNGLPRQRDPVAVTSDNIGPTARQVKAGRAFVSAPAFGFDTALAQGDPGEVERLVLEQELVTAKDFHIGSIPRLSSAGVRREILMPVFPMQCAIDEADHGKVRMAFRLNRGCYATTLLREFMKAEVLAY